MGDERATYLKTDTAGAITFLKALRPGRCLWVLTAIWPDGPTTTQSFEASDEVGAQPVSSRTPTTWAGTSISPAIRAANPEASREKAGHDRRYHVARGQRPTRRRNDRGGHKNGSWPPHRSARSATVDHCLNSGNGLQGLWLLEREFVFPKRAQKRARRARLTMKKSKCVSRQSEDRNRALAIREADCPHRGLTTPTGCCDYPGRSIFQQREEDGAGPDHTPVEPSSS